MRQEVYKVIRDFTGYEVSDLGNVRSRKTDKVLKGRDNGCGYQQVRLCREGSPQQKELSIHRLVIATFLGDSSLTVDHINENKTDNRLCNLRYLTNKVNAKLANQGSKNARAKLTEEVVSEIKQHLSQGLSAKVLARQYNVCARQIYRIRSGTRWSHVV